MHLAVHILLREDNQTVIGVALLVETDSTISIANRLLMRISLPERCILSYEIRSGLGRIAHVSIAFAIPFNKFIVSVSVGPGRHATRTLCHFLLLSA